MFLYFVCGCTFGCSGGTPLSSTAMARIGLLAILAAVASELFEKWVCCCEAKKREVIGSERKY
ncbi:hypothetical protein [Novipirellula sp.]|uniref:hypothetical protein n=1 Tax=Novipirellula sp. TaxID=2795430 RepID=UPI003563A66E